MVPKAKGKGRRQSTPSPYKGRKDSTSSTTDDKTEHCTHVNKAVAPAVVRKAVIHRKNLHSSLCCLSCGLNSSAATSNRLHWKLPSWKKKEGNTQQSQNPEFENHLVVCLRCGEPSCRETHLSQHIKTPRSDSHVAHLILPRLSAEEWEKSDAATETNNLCFFCGDCQKEYPVSSACARVQETVGTILRACARPAPVIDTLQFYNDELDVSWEHPLGAQADITTYSPLQSPKPPTNTGHKKGKSKEKNMPPSSQPQISGNDTPATAASFSSGLPSSSSTSSISGITLPSVKGLQNLGNTCFANSVLQSLSQALPFVEAFDTLRKEGYVLETSVPLLSGTPNGSGEPTTGTEMPKKPLKLTLPEPGPFSEAFGSLLKQMSNTATKQAVVTPSHFVSLFQQEHSAGSGRWFQAGHQHDAHELLRFLLARISEEENNRITASLLTSSQLSFSCKSADDFKPDQLSEEQLKEWESVKDICQSSSVEYFFGAQILTRALCEECGRLHFSISLQMDIPLYLNAEDGEEPCSQGKPKGSPAGQTKGKEWKSKRERREAAKLNKKLQKKKRKEGEKSVSMEELAAANNRHNASPTEQEGDPTEKEEDEETTVEEEETVHNETEGDSGSPPPASDGDVSLATSVEEGKEEEGEEFPVEVVTKEERDSGCGSGESLQEEEDGRSRKEESEDRSVTDQKAFCDETLAERLAELKLSHEDSGGESSVQDDDDDNEDARSEVEEEEDGIIAKLVSVFEPKVLFTPTTSGMMDLPTLISRFLGEDKIGLECRGCGYERNKGKKVLIRSPHVRSHLILRPPPLLTLHVQRATFGLLHWRRNTRKTTRRDATPVQVTSILDLTPFCVSSNTSWIYDLFAVIAHEGGQANSGHYVAYVKQRALGSTPTASLTQVIGATKSLKSRKLSRALELLDLNKADPVSSSGGSQAKSLGPSQWYRASDSSVKAVKEEEVLKTGNRGEAYLLFYELKMAAK